jgi:predicted DNA-binding WGR domain protein
VAGRLAILALPSSTPEEIEASKRIREYAALFEVSDTVMWTGKKPENADQFVEVRIEAATGGKTPGLNVLVRSGKIGSKGTTEKENYVHRKHALHVAAVRLSSARDRGFGP